ncbi:tripartite tricarboxylate transporter permease [Falsiroseomonas oryzae]|uniref:tripartite tricarboxylate transporter permease n=1 Tax=Falsiroseomonas oryzae TaxID=2766473 RepID=UPI0022EB6FB1|nr:tripartite tricarboxylate transporter permease [Roseomonas sp. MO-31]
MELDLATLAELFGRSFSLWWAILPGIALGLVVGVLPGFSPQNTLIILLPVTLAMDTEAALAFMISLYCANHLSGGIPAILVNIPGSGGAAATCIDGYQMTKKGQAQQALVLSFVASVAGGLITSVAVLALLPFLAQLGLVLRSVEMVVIILFGLTLIAVLAAKDMLKGLIGGMFGLMLGAIGTDTVYSTPRATFGFLELYDGLPLVPVLIGLFAISEALVMLEERFTGTPPAQSRAAQWKDTVEGLWMCVKYWWQITWTAFLGLVVGVIPGAGAYIASFVAYQQSRLFSKTPELYGTGHPPGVIAPESANNGVTSGTLVPTMAIGVPGGSTAAVMMIVLQYQGITVGPRLFQESPAIAYGVFVMMTVAYIFMIPMVMPLARYASRVVTVPVHYIVPLILALTVVGAFADREYVFDMVLALVFGVIGYIAVKSNYHVTSILIGVLLGPIFERYLLRSLRIGQGDIMVLFSSPIANVLWALLVISVVLPIWRERRLARTAA